MKNIDHILSLYLTNQASKQQLELLRNWENKSDENARTLKKMEQAWNISPKQKFHFNENEVSDRVWNRLQSSSPTKHRFINFRTLLRSAGVILLMATISYLLIQGLQDGIHKEELAKKETISPEPVIKSNPTGVKSTIRLPDGSTVILNAESTLKYNFKKGDTIRFIELDGEAYFNVMKDIHKPFVVQAGNMRTTALGTEFNVNSYSNEHVKNVSLSEGKVLVDIEMGQEFKSYVLDPGQCVDLDENKETIIKSIFDYNERVGWIDGVITFKKDSLQQVLAKLSRWYGVDFELKNYHGIPWRYNGEFKDEYLDVILKNMSYSQHFDYEISKGNVVINFKN